MKRSAGFITTSVFFRAAFYDNGAWLNQVDETLAPSDWDKAWARMMNLIDLTFNNRYLEGRGSPHPR
jgi:hypothetical protein